MIHLDDHPDDPDERYIPDRHLTSSKIKMLYTIGPFGAIRKSLGKFNLGPNSVTTP